MERCRICCRVQGASVHFYRIFSRLGVLNSVGQLLQLLEDIYLLTFAHGFGAKNDVRSIGDGLAQIC